MGGAAGRGSGGVAVTPGRGRSRALLRDLAELVRAPAALTVPGDVLAGSAAAGLPLGPRTAGLAASSVGLYWAGMALNDWADREEDARDRPGRPIPSGRISPRTALLTATALTAGGLGLAALSGGRRTLLTRALPLAATVWAYDLGLKSTPLGPAAMAAARGLDVLLGAGPAPARGAVVPALLMAAHTHEVTRLSRFEVEGCTPAEPRAALAATAALGVAAAAPGPGTTRATGAVAAAGAALYAATAGRAQYAAARRPDAPRVRGAVKAGIHAMLPLQAALVARAGRPALAAPLVAALPLAARLARKVSPT